MITTTNANGEVTIIPTQPAKGLSQSDQIALGVGLGIGIPTLILAYLSWRVAARKKDETIRDALLAALTLGLLQRQPPANESGEESYHGNRGRVVEQVPKIVTRNG